jgi:hypothetical protein
VTIEHGRVGSAEAGSTRFAPQAPAGLGPAGDDPARLGEAIALAARAHAAQVDKGGKPYILHPLRVMFAVQGHGEDAMVAAVLHDVVEDCGIFLHDIAMQFGEPVAAAVDALTRRDGESYNDFIERCGRNDIAREVKRKDLSDNSDIGRLRKVEASDWARIQKYSRAYDRLSAIAMEARQGTDPKGLDSEAATARAEGIAQKEAS